MSLRHVTSVPHMLPDRNLVKKKKKLYEATVQYQSSIHRTRHNDRKQSADDIMGIYMWWQSGKYLSAL